MNGPWGTQPEITSKAKRRADRITLATYHEARLADLLEHIRQGFAEYDAGRIDAFELDGIVHHYTLAARELWKFCAVSGQQATFAVRTLEWWRQDGEERDWWELPERSPRRRW
ncbi:MAG TPA: hypothetical protein VK457_14335 [Chloroflexota bacterium]|nr:hypothetical protein [Chloroflexota bacterium]